MFLRFDSNLNNDKRDLFFKKKLFNFFQVTMSIARDMAPKRILGMDIDDMLICKARKLLKQYANTKVPSGMSSAKTV